MKKKNNSEELRPKPCFMMFCCRSIMTPPPELPLTLYCALIGCRFCRCHFQSKHISHCRTLSRRQVQIFSVLNISRICDNTHYANIAHVNEHRFLPQILAICHRFPQNCAVCTQHMGLLSLIFENMQSLRWQCTNVMILYEQI